MSKWNGPIRARQQVARKALLAWGWEEIIVAKTQIFATFEGQRIDWCIESLAKHVLGWRSTASGCDCGRCPQ